MFPIRGTLFFLFFFSLLLLSVMVGRAILLLSLVLAVAALAHAAKPVTKLQIGVKKRPETCELKSKVGDSLSMHYTVSACGVVCVAAWAQQASSFCLHWNLPSLLHCTPQQQLHRYSHAHTCTLTL
jgi:hypothetical protein